ncbi:MAG TPA: DUF86 domain-containing protein [Candidatus Latescibacteria bacterium]|nr:DUF86 domain-containing protein [Candidatus Latescibacterota bacterium]
MKNDKIAELLRVIKESLDMLREYQDVKLTDYRRDRRTQDIVEREFERAILACADIGARIISLRRFPPASSYVEIFDILSQKDVLPSQLAEVMKDLVRFRNVLVHEYFRIDPELVYKKLQDELETLVEFGRCVEKL